MYYLQQDIWPEIWLFHLRPLPEKKKEKKRKENPSNLWSVFDRALDRALVSSLNVKIVIT